MTRRPLPLPIGDAIPEHQWVLLAEALHWNGTEAEFISELKELAKRYGIPLPIAWSSG